MEYLAGSGGSTQIGDVTGDGRADVVMRAGSGIEVFAQTSAGTLAPSILYPSNFAEAMRVGDLNGDGRLDAIGLEFSINGHDNTEEAGIWYQNPAGSFDPQVLVPLPHGFGDDAELADLNNDGRLDVVVVNAFNEPVIVILYQNADGSMSAPVPLSIGPGVLAQQVGAGDINHDGRKDLVVAYGGYITDVHLAVFRQNADGTLAAETLTTLPPAGGHSQQGVVATDLNDDGATDVAYATVGAQGSLTLLYGIAPPPPTNHPPVAKADSATLVCDTTVAIAVLANDSDPDQDPLSITTISKPTHGTARLTADGKRIRYEPKRRFRGTDRFTYSIADGKGGTASAIVTVIVIVIVIVR